MLLRTGPSPFTPLLSLHSSPLLPLMHLLFPHIHTFAQAIFPPLEITLSASYVPLQSLLILQDSDEIHVLSHFPKHSIHTDIHVLGIPEASLSAPCTAQSYCSVTAPILQLIVPNSLKVVIYKQKNTSIFLKITVFKYDVSILFLKILCKKVNGGRWRGQETSMCGCLSCAPY